jgi:hypothetical protein
MSVSARRRRLMALCNDFMASLRFAGDLADWCSDSGPIIGFRQSVGEPVSDSS